MMEAVQLRQTKGKPENMSGADNVTLQTFNNNNSALGLTFPVTLYNNCMISISK